MPTLQKKSADKFIEIMVENTPLLKLISFTKMRDPISSYPLMTLNRFKTQPIGRLDIAGLNKVSDIMINFNAKELVLSLIIPDSYIEDMESSHERIANYAAKVFGMDLQYLFINGDKDVDVTDEKTRLQSSMDGIVKQIKNAGRTLKITGQDPSELEKIKQMIMSISDTHLADPELKILIGGKAYSLLWDSINTKSADKSLLLHGDKIIYRGKEVIEVPELEKIVIINPEHVVGGICRDITVEQQRYPAARGNIVVCSARVDFQVVTEAALMEE